MGKCRLYAKDCASHAQSFCKIKRTATARSCIGEIRRSLGEQPHRIQSDGGISGAGPFRRNIDTAAMGVRKQKRSGIYPFSQVIGGCDRRIDPYGTVRDRKSIIKYCKNQRQKKIKEVPAADRSLPSLSPSRLQSERPYVSRQIAPKS